MPRIRSKQNLPDFDADNTTKENDANTTKSGHTTYEAKPTRSTSADMTNNTSSTTSSNHNTRRPSSTNSTTVDSTYNADNSNRTNNSNKANSSERTGNTKNSMSYQSRNNDYMTPRPSHLSPPLPIPPGTKNVASPEADCQHNHYTGTNSDKNLKTRDVTSRQKAPPLPQPRIKHSSSMLDLSSSESCQSIKSSNDYMTPRSSRQTPFLPLPPETKDVSSPAERSKNYYTEKRANTNVETGEMTGKPRPPPLPKPRIYHSSSTSNLSSSESCSPNDYMIPRSSLQTPLLSPETNGRNSTTPDSQHYYTPRTNSNKPPPPPPRPESTSLYCDKGNSAMQRTETPPLYDPEEETYIPSTSSQYTSIGNPRYTPVLPDNYFEWTREPTRLYGEDHDTGNHSSIYELSSNDIEGLLQWLKKVSRQSDTPSLYGLSMGDEIRSFNQKAMNVRKARRLYNLLIMKRKEPMEKTLNDFKAICEKLDKAKKTTKNMGIAGGATGAVGGVTAVVGIALAPVTMGVSLIATAVGAGIAAGAGGFGAKAAMANKKIVNRGTVEKLVEEYKANVVDLERCLNYILCVMKELRRHDIGTLRSNRADPDALRMVALSNTVFNNNMNNRQTSPNNPGGMTSESLLKNFAKEFDVYFTEKNGQKLKKSNKSKFSCTVCILVKSLEEEFNYLQQMWEVLN